MVNIFKNYLLYFINYFSGKSLDFSNGIAFCSLSTILYLLFSTTIVLSLKIYGITEIPFNFNSFFYLFLLFVAALPYSLFYSYIIILLNAPSSENEKNIIKSNIDTKLYQYHFPFAYTSSLILMLLIIVIFTLYHLCRRYKYSNLTLLLFVAIFITASFVKTKFISIKIRKQNIPSIDNKNGFQRKKTIDYRPRLIRIFAICFILPSIVAALCLILYSYNELFRTNTKEHIYQAIAFIYFIIVFIILFVMLIKKAKESDNAIRQYQNTGIEEMVDKVSRYSHVALIKLYDYIKANGNENDLPIVLEELFRRELIDKIERDNLGIEYKIMNSRVITNANDPTIAHLTNKFIYIQKKRYISWDSIIKLDEINKVTLKKSFVDLKKRNILLIKYKSGRFYKNIQIYDENLQKWVENISQSKKEIEVSSYEN